MTFQSEKVTDFQNLFGLSKDRIRAFEGVQKLELLQDLQQENVFFTYSYWESEAHLEKYRKSDLFKSVWSQTKLLFEEDAQAWSVNKVVSL